MFYSYLFHISSMFYISSIFYKKRPHNVALQKPDDDNGNSRETSSSLEYASSDELGRATVSAIPSISVRQKSFVERAARVGRRKGAANDQEYDPHQNRRLEYPLTNVEAGILIMKGSLGTAFLAMPLAFNLAGCIPTAICWIILSVIMLYSIHILINSMYELCKREGIPTLSYPKALRIALAEGPKCLRVFSIPSIFIADIILTAYHMSACIVYIMFIAANIKDLIDMHILHMDSRFIMCLSVVPLLPLAIARQLKTLIPFWALAIFLQLLALFVLLLYSLSNLPEFNMDGLFSQTFNYPDGIALILLSFQSVGVLLPIESQMANPKAFLGTKGILVRTHIFLIFWYMTLGFFGHWRFGIEIEDNIALNLPEYELTPQLIRIALAIAMFLSFPLQAYAIIDAIWHHWISILIHRDDRNTLEYIVRCLVVMLSAICSICFISITAALLLVASFCLTTLGITFPALMDVCVRHKHGYGQFKIYLIRDILILIIGIALSTLCVFTSLTPMVESYRIK